VRGKQIKNMMIKLLFSSRRLLSNTIESGNTNVYSLEVSMYGYKPNAKSDKILPYTEENCGGK
jgi:hypothetical protein